MKIIKSLSAFLMIAVICVCSCSCSRRDSSPESKVIYYNLASEPDTLDPQIAADKSSELIITNIFEGLVRLDKNGDITEGAASDWDISVDGRQYTFHLRDGLKWSNGDDLTASDFEYGLMRSVSSQTNSPTASTLFCIKGAEKINKGQSDDSSLGVTAKNSKTLVITLEYPEDQLLYLLTTPPAMPCNKSFFESSGGQYGRTDEKIICNGAFTLDKGDWKSKESFFLTRNVNYRGKEKPVPAGISLSIGKEYDNLCDAIIEGQTDCGSIGRDDLDKAKKNNLKLTSFENYLWGISFNTENDILNNTGIRQSLLSFIDKNYLLKDIPEHCSGSDNIIPESAKLDGKNYRKIAGDITYTKTDDPGKLFKKSLKELDKVSIPNMTILCLKDEKSQAFVNDLIETWNKATGAYFNKKPLTEQELRERVFSGSFQIAIAPLDISSDSPQEIISAFSSDSEINPSALNSEFYDSLVDEVKDDLTISSLATIKQAETAILDNALFYPLYIEYRYCASASNIDNIIFRSYDQDIDFFYATKKEE